MAADIPWRLKDYSLTARDMQLKDALEGFSAAQGIPIILSPLANGTFSANLEAVPSGEFLGRLTAMHNLVWYYDGASIYVSTIGESQTALIDLRYMKAKEVKEMLAELGVEDGRFPIKTASNGELIMVSGPPRYVSLVSEMISKADKLREQRTFNEVEVKLFPLRHTWADDIEFNGGSSPAGSITLRGVAALLQDIMQEEAGEKFLSSTNEASITQNKLDAALGSPRPVIRAENRLNAVVVRDRSTRMKMYEEIVSKLDVPQQLVEIGVTVLEMSKSDALDWQLSLNADSLRDKTQIAGGQNAQNAFSPGAIAGQGLAGAFTYIGDSLKFGASLTALRKKGKARNISRTSVIAVNNMSAQMTDTQSYHARIVGSDVAALEEVSAGTRLEIRPRIMTEDGEKRQIWLSMALQDGGFESVTVDSMPMTRSSTIETQAVLPDGEALLLAGYFRDIEEDGGWGIPYLRNIPLIGWLFGGASTHKETVQRLFIISPRIIDISAWRENPDMVPVNQLEKSRDFSTERDLYEKAGEKDFEESLKWTSSERDGREKRREIKAEAKAANASAKEESSE